MKKNIYKNKLPYVFYILIILLIISFLSNKLIDFSLYKALNGVPNAFIWMLQNFIPTKASLAKIPAILKKILETFLLSVSATTTGGFFAFVLSFAGSKTTSLSKPLSLLARIIASIFRNIPNAVWAMILLLSFGQNILTGYFALFFVSFGFLSRAFIETLDELGQETLEGLTSVGASHIQILYNCVLPSVIGQFCSWILYMIETNIRSSTLIGMLTGTGIGFLFDIYYKSSQYHAAGLVVAAITISILMVEFLSNYIRRRLC